MLKAVTTRLATFFLLLGVIVCHSVSVTQAEQRDKGL